MTFIDEILIETPTRMKERISGIYLIINIINNKKYVGSSNDIYHRFVKHRSALKRNTHRNLYLQNAWNKYGENNFRFYIIEKCNFSQLELKENCWINFFLSYKRDFGYNIQPRALNKQHSEETKIKIGKANKKAWKGRRPEQWIIDKMLKNKPLEMSKETKAKISKNHAKFWKGKTFSKEHRQKLSLALTGKRLGLKLSQDKRNLLSEAHKKDKKQIEQLDKNGNFIQVFESARSINQKFGFNKKVIQAICTGKRPSAYGYKWRYKNADSETPKK